MSRQSYILYRESGGSKLGCWVSMAPIGLSSGQHLQARNLLYNNSASSVNFQNIIPLRSKYWPPHQPNKRLVAHPTSLPQYVPFKKLQLCDWVDNTQIGQACTAPKFVDQHQFKGKNGIQQVLAMRVLQLFSHFLFTATLQGLTLLLSLFHR